MPDSISTSSGIYAICSEVNGRRYIGSAVNLRQRWSQHRSALAKNLHDNPHLQNSWNKYGGEAFEFVVLEECSVEVLIEREQHYLDSCIDKYNCNPTAGSSRGYRHTPEAKAKVSAAQLGNTKAAGHTVSDDAREKIRQANLGRKQSPETIAKRVVSLTGQKRTPEQCAKFSAAKMGHEVSEETREKIRRSNTGNKNASGSRSSEAREKMKNAQLARRERERLMKLEEREAPGNE